MDQKQIDELYCDMDSDFKIDQIRIMIPRAARYEQMAEECVELAQALLKKARKIRLENFTPRTHKEINNDVIEEFTDVMLCAKTLDIKSDSQLMNQKLNRWMFRNDQTVKNTNSDTDSNTDFKKVATQYHYHISLEAINNALKRLYFESPIMYVQDGWWDIPDDDSVLSFSVRLSGIGLFDDYNKELPVVIINTEKQVLYILDEKHLDQVYNHSKKFTKMLYLTLYFEEVFDERMTWDDVLRKISNERAEICE